MDLDPGRSHLVHEPNRLEQVLVNLVLNALHAVGGEDAPRVSVRLHTEEGAVRRLPRRREDDPPGINYMHRRRAAQEDMGGLGAR